ncbi:hypothetical protein TXIAM_90546 [Tenacibaculum xiamenense]
MPIIKQIPFKGRYETLIDYILKGASQTEDFTIFKNISGGVGRDTVVKSFIENDKYRGKRIKTRCQHVILSWHFKSNPSPEALWKVTNELLRLRGMDACVVFGKAHFDSRSGCTHIHLMVSQNLYLQDKSVISGVKKKQLLEQNIALEKMQQREFPELNDSLVFIKSRTKEQEPYQKSNKKHRVNKLIDVLNGLADTAKSLKHLYELIDQHSDLEAYSRGNTQYYGVWFGKEKYRIKKYITPERYSALERLELMREVMERSDREYGQENSLTR